MTGTPRDERHCGRRLLRPRGPCTIWAGRSGKTAGQGMPMVAYWPADRSSTVLDISVGDMLREAAAAAPGAAALVAGTARQGDRRRWTYTELLEQSEQAARALLGRFEPGERVAVWANNIPEWVMLEFAAALAG